MLVDAGDILKLLDRAGMNLVLCGQLAYPLGLEIKQHACYQLRELSALLKFVGKCLSVTI